MKSQKCLTIVIKLGMLSAVLGGMYGSDSRSRDQLNS